MKHGIKTTRRLLRCPHCRDWFNTTEYIFAKHLLKHRSQLPSGVEQVLDGFVRLEDWLRTGTGELP